MNGLFVVYVICICNFDGIFMFVRSLVYRSIMYRSLIYIVVNVNVNIFV